MVSTRALETAYLHEFGTFLVLGVWGRFLGCFGGSKNTPLDASVLGGLASESVEMPEPERTGTGGTRSGTGRNQILTLTLGPNNSIFLRFGPFGTRIQL